MKKPELETKRSQWNRVRPADVVVDGAIVHSMAELVLNESEEYGPTGVLRADDWLVALKLSAHAFIFPSGKILRAVPDELVAFHAGRSSWRDRRDLNDSFLGAEFLVAGAHDYGSWLQAIANPDTYTEEQYNAGGWLYATWLRAFPDMSLERIRGHSEVSGDDVRGLGKGKEDPGPGFNWDKLYGSIRAWREELGP